MLETATPVPPPATAEQPNEFSQTPTVTVDDEGITIELGVTVPKDGVRARSSTSYSAGKISITTTYEVNDTLIDFPWTAESTTPESTEMACNTIGTLGSWRGNPLPIGDNIIVGELKLRIDESVANPESLALVIENSSNERVEIQEHAFVLIDNLWSQSADGPRDYLPSFAEMVILGVNGAKTFTIDLNALSEDSVEPEDVVLAFSDWESGDAVYLHLSEPPVTPHICNAFEPHAEAQGAGTTSSNRPAPLGRAVKVDDATTVRVTYAERGVAQHLIEAYNDLNRQVTFPKNEDGELADGYEFLAFQIEVASNYPIMRGDNARDPIEAVNVLGRIADEYSLEFEEIFSTPDAANLVMLEEPSDVSKLNARGYMRLSFVAVTPVETYGLYAVYASDFSQTPAFLSLEENPSPRPTPIP